MKIQCFLLSACCGTWFVQCQISIPEGLRECYSNTTVENLQIPMNLRILIDIIRKAERKTYTTMDMRTVATSLLHRFKFDGIEYNENVNAAAGVSPFSGSGPQRVKHKIVEELIPGDAEAFPSKELSLAERCALHRMVSNTVWNHRSANEDKLCESGPTEKIFGRSLFGPSKNCPVELGVVITPFGTIAPGTVIGAIAASLQPQNVAIKQLLMEPDLKYPESPRVDVSILKYNEKEIDFVMPKDRIAIGRSMWLQSLDSSPAKLDNIWAATLAGDLAEMTVYQGPLVGSSMTLGATGFWNSTMRPNIYYLTNKRGSFDATRAEIIGGIDGLIIGKNLQTWIDSFHSLRLSQVLDMYYSDKGVTFNTRIKACERARGFLQVAPRTILDEQTYSMSHVLAYRNSVAYMTDEALERMVGYATGVFTSYAENHLFSELHCHNEKSSPRVEIVVAFDGAWSREYTADFLAVMAEDLDVSMFGSKMGLMHGTTGEWIFNITNSPASVYHSISNLMNIAWPTTLDYTKVLKNVYKYLNNTWEERHKSHVIGGLGQAIVLLGPLVSLSETEQESVISLLRRIKDDHPEVHFLYYVSEYNSRTFKSFLLSEEDHLIKSSDIDDITRHILMVPMTLRPISCNSKITVGVKDQYEDYISPLQSTTYRLHPHWRNNTKEVKISVHVYGYGSMKACSWIKWKINGYEEGRYCKELTGHNEITLTDYTECIKGKPCPSTYYRVQNVSSLVKCAEMDCKLPDQVRFIIRIENLYCPGASVRVSLTLVSLIVSAFLTIFL